MEGSLSLEYDNRNCCSICSALPTNAIGCKRGKVLLLIDEDVTFGKAENPTVTEGSRTMKIHFDNVLEDHMVNLAAVAEQTCCRDFIVSFHHFLILVIGKGKLIVWWFKLHPLHSDFS